MKMPRWMRIDLQSPWPYIAIALIFTLLYICTNHHLPHTQDFADSLEYLKVKDWISKGQWQQVFNFNRGPSFPLFWWLSDLLGLKLIYTASLFNLFGLIAFIGAGCRWDHKLGPFLATTALLVYTSAAQLSYNTSYLTEAILLGSLTWNLSSILCLLKLQHKAARPITILAFWLSSLWIYGLKFWLGVVPITFLCLQLLFGLRDRTKPQRLLMQLLGLVILCSSFLAIHRPKSNRSNVSATLIRFQAPELISTIGKAQSDPTRANYYHIMAQQLAVKVENCRIINRDRLSCLVRDQQLDEYFKLAYLSNWRGPLAILRHSFQGWYNNVSHATSLSDMYYGPTPRFTHFIWRKWLKGYTKFCFWIGLFCLPWILYQALRSQHPNIQRDRFFLYMGLTSMALNLFLAFASSNEQGRVELPGMDFFYLHCALITAFFFNWLTKGRFFTGALEA